jgi:hypothetical protein
MTKLCATCLPGAPRHLRQRVVVRHGRRFQVCENCGVTLFQLDEPRQKTAAKKRDGAGNSFALSLLSKGIKQTLRTPVRLHAADSFPENLEMARRVFCFTPHLPREK